MAHAETKGKVDKGLQDDKAYLKHCLESKAPQGDLLRWKENWWACGDTVITVARILGYYGMFNGQSQVIDYFEKPYKYHPSMKFIIEEM